MLQASCAPRSCTWDEKKSTTRYKVDVRSLSSFLYILLRQWKVLITASDPLIHGLVKQFESTSPKCYVSSKEILQWLFYTLCCTKTVAVIRLNLTTIIFAFFFMGGLHFCMTLYEIISN